MKRGGLLEMLKRYRFNFLRNKNKKIKKSIFSFLVIITYPIVLFFSQFKKSNKIIIKSKISKEIEEEIISIENKITSPISIKQVEKSIKKIEKKIEKVEPENKKIFEKRIENIKNELSLCKIQESNENINQINIKAKSSINSEQLNSVYQEPSRTIDIFNQNVNKKKNISNQKPNEVEKSLSRLDYKIILKEADEKITKIVSKIPSALYNDLYDFERDLKEIETKIARLKEEYKKYNMPFDYKFSGLSLEKIEEQLKEANKKIKEKKDELYNKREVKKEPIKEEKKETKKEVKKIKEQDIDINILANRIILERIEKQNKIIDEYNKKIINRKKYLIRYLRRIAFDIFSIFSLRIFKSKLFNTLISSLIVNNSLKNMRKLIDRKNANYEVLNNEVYSNNLMLLEIERLNNNSLDEIYNLKGKLLTIYNDDLNNIELNSLLIELDTIENKILSANEKSKKFQATLEHNKQKIKKWY